jgi:hypothetical protein
MTVALYHAKLEKALKRAGGLYALSDILERIADGRMQSFVEDNSWAVTQISLFPRARALEFIALVGDLKDIEALQEQVLAFARRTACDIIVAQGRHGWAPLAKKLGWGDPVSRNMIFLRKAAP